MRRNICAVLFVFMLSMGALADDRQAAAQRYLEDYLEERGYASVSAAAAYRGEIVFAGAAGFADIEEKVPATPETLYRIGSVSKVMTGIGIMQLVEAGQLELDRPILDYMPGVSTRWDGITPRHLLTHTSGIMHYGRGHPWNRYTEYENTSDVIRLFADEKLLFKPGQGQSYSTYGFALLQALAETITGQGFEAYLEANVWQPAGMPTTMFDRFYQKPSTRAKGYRPWAFGRLGSLKATDDNVSFKYAGGGILSTPTEMVKLCQAFMKDELVGSETRAEMMRRQAGRFGLAWNIVNTRDTGELYRIFHSGESQGFVANLNCYAKDGYAFAAVVNTWNNGSNVFRDPIEFFAETFADIPRQPDFW